MRGGAGAAVGREGKYGKPPPVCAGDGCPYWKGDSLNAGSGTKQETMTDQKMPVLVELRCSSLP